MYERAELFVQTTNCSVNENGYRNGVFVPSQTWSFKPSFSLSSGRNEKEKNEPRKQCCRASNHSEARSHRNKEEKKTTKVATLFLSLSLSKTETAQRKKKQREREKDREIERGKDLEQTRGYAPQSNRRKGRKGSLHLHRVRK